MYDRRQPRRLCVGRRKVDGRRGLLFRNCRLPLERSAISAELTCNWTVLPLGKVADDSNYEVVEGSHVLLSHLDAYYEVMSTARHTSYPVNEELIKRAIPGMDQIRTSFAPSAISSYVTFRWLGCQSYS